MKENLIAKKIPKMINIKQNFNCEIVNDLNVPADVAFSFMMGHMRVTFAVSPKLKCHLVVQR